MKKRRFRIVEIGLLSVLVVSIAAAVVIQVSKKDGENAENTSQTATQSDDVDKYEALLNADAEDEETYKMLYSFGQKLNRETFFKYQVKNVGEEVSCCTLETKPGQHRADDVLEGIQKYTVTEVEVLDSYEEGDTQDWYVLVNQRDYDELVDEQGRVEGHKFVRLTVCVSNSLDEPYVGGRKYIDCGLMADDAHYIRTYRRMAREFPKDENIQFYTELRLENMSNYVPVESIEDGSYFLMEPGATHTFRQIFLVPDEDVNDENLAYGGYEIAKETARGAVTYRNRGFRILLNRKGES